MKVKCINGCFEKVVPEHLEKEIKADERGLVCTSCFGKVKVID